VNGISNWEYALGGHYDGVVGGFVSWLSIFEIKCSLNYME
jgi:hypothetical protein